MALFFDYYIILASDWSIVRSQYTPSRSTPDGKIDGGGVLDFRCDEQTAD